MTRIEKSPHFNFLPDSIAEPLKKLDTTISVPLQQALKEVWQAIKEAWELIKNPIDPDWRKNQKYEHVLEEMKQGFLELLQTSPDLQFSEESVQQPLNQWREEIAQQKGVLLERPSFMKGSHEECTYYVKKALQILDSNSSFKTERERYKAFITTVEKALGSEYYQTAINRGNLNADEMRQIEETHVEVAVLHTLALVQFTRVNTQGFTESLAHAMAKEGGFKPHQVSEFRPSEATPSSSKQEEHLLGLFKTCTGQIPSFTEAVSEASGFHKISSHSAMGASLNASNRYTSFYPIKEGNPVNINYTVRKGERVVTCIRSPTVTVGMNKISPTFKAYLRALKSRGQKLSYINLQDRRPPSQQIGIRKPLGHMGFVREDLRSRTLENLNLDPEFIGVLSIFTFDKNSEFYHQRVNLRAANDLLRMLLVHGVLEDGKIFAKQLQDPLKEADAVEELLRLYNISDKSLPPLPPDLLQDKIAFIEEFKKRLWDPEGSFHISQEYREGVENILEEVTSTLFGKQRFLSPLERQDLIEMVYEFMADYLLDATEADYFVEACKENIDRGGGVNCQKLSSRLLTEILTNPDRQHLERDIGLLVSKLNEGALWSRKRAVNERMGRTVQAMKRMGQFATQDRTGFLHLVQMANGGSFDVEVVLEPKKNQMVRNFNSSYRRAEEALVIADKIIKTRERLRKIAGAALGQKPPSQIL